MSAPDGWRTLPFSIGQFGAELRAHRRLFDTHLDVDAGGLQQLHSGPRDARIRVDGADDHS